jgi:hypothetical protein
MVDPKRFERLRRVSKTPMLPLHQGSIKKCSGKENVNLYLYVIPVIFTLGILALRLYITPKVKCHIHIHPPMWNAYFCILPKISSNSIIKEQYHLQMMTILYQKQT